MDTNVYDHYGLTFEALPQKPGEDPGINFNRLRIQEGGNSTIALWLTREQADALRVELDKLYPRVAAAAVPLEDAEETATTRYADEHAGEFAEGAR